MKTLREHNKEILDNTDTSKSKLNGIECPNCKKELYDSLDSSINLYILYITPVHCGDCGYISGRLTKP